MAYEASSLHVSGFLAAAAELGVLEKAEPKLSPQSQTTIAHLFEQKWVPATVIQDLTACIGEAYGNDSLEHLNYLMTKRSLGRLVLPMLRVALAITGSSPATIFSRLGDSLKVAMRGVESTWVRQSETSGTVTLRYPVVPPQIVHHAWRGVFRFGFEITGHDGRLVAHRYLDGGKTLELDVTWDA